MLTVTDETLRTKVARTIQRLQDEDMTLRDIARALGCSDQAVGNWKNKNRAPNAVLLMRLADLIDEPISYFLDNR